MSDSDLQTTMKLINRNFTVIVIVILALFGGYQWQRAEGYAKNGAPTTGTVVNNNAPTQPTGPTAATLAKMPKVSDSDHWLGGNKKAKVVLVEYSDYECPFCARFHPTMQQALKDYGDKIGWVWRHYPLSFHPNAQKSAEGSECVAKLGGEAAFIKYTDSLIAVNTQNGKLTPEAIVEAAQDAGVDATAFKSCLDSGEMATKVKEQMTAGGTAGITGTPGTIIVVDGVPKELVPGALGIDALKTMVDKYVK